MQITYTATHIAGDGVGRLSIQPQMLQGVFYSSSHSDRFSGALHPFSRSFFTPVQSVTAAEREMSRAGYGRFSVFCRYLLKIDWNDYKTSNS